MFFSNNIHLGVIWQCSAVQYPEMGVVMTRYRIGGAENGFK